MSDDIFADTSGLLLYLDPRQTGHVEARDVARQHLRARRRFVTTNYILTELVALFSARTRLSRTEICAAVQAVQQSAFFQIVHITPELHQRAFDLLQSRPDKNWSWVDAASFVVMEDRGLHEALTTDHHFAQAGFRALLHLPA